MMLYRLFGVVLNSTRRELGFYDTEQRGNQCESSGANKNEGKEGYGYSSHVWAAQALTEAAQLRADLSWL